MTVSRHTVAAALAVGLGATLALGACAPGSGGGSDRTTSPSDVSTDVDAAGDVTLTVWDVNSEGSANDAQEQLNAAFEAAHPNVTIERVARSFSDIKTTLGLALDSGDAPDVVQANQGYPDMGTFVSAGLLRPLDDYADLYGWRDEFPAGQLALNSFSEDGSVWQGDRLYGVSQTGEIVGVYYNRAILDQLGIDVPTTVSEFDAALGTVAAAGVLPIAFGNSEQWPGIHLFGAVQAAVAGADTTRELVTGQGGSWADEPTVQAATLLQSWADQGYLTPESGGVAPDAARTTFADGGAAFFIGGTWNTVDIAAGLGDDAGFLALAPDGSDVPTAIGGIGLAWAMSSASENPDVAAAYIDFVTNADAEQVMFDSGNLPAVVPAGVEPEAGSTEADVIDTWTRINTEDALLPYLDYTTTTFYDTITAGVQELLADRLTPADFASRLQDDASAFHAAG